MKYMLCFTVSRGIFNQGYLCMKCGLGAHKECLGRLGVCGRTGEVLFWPNTCYLENHFPPFHDIHSVCINQPFLTP